MGVTCTSVKGSLLKALSSHNPVLNSEEGEIMAPLVAIQCALSINIKHLLLRGDAKGIVGTLLEAGNPQIVSIENTISMARDLLAHLDLWSIKFVNWANNYIAHNVAKWTASQHFM